MWVSYTPNQLQNLLGGSKDKILLYERSRIIYKKSLWIVIKCVLDK